MRNKSKSNDRNECLIPFKWCDRTIGAGAGACKSRLIGEENECCDLKTGGGPRFSREVYRRNVVNFEVFKARNVEIVRELYFSDNQTLMSMRVDWKGWSRSLVAELSSGKVMLVVRNWRVHRIVCPFPFGE